MTSNRLTEHKAELSELKPRVQQIRDDLLAKLDQLNVCIESAEKLNQEAVTMTKNLEDNLANVSNETKEWKELEVKLASTAIEGKVILDVGGERYTTSAETLTREKDTFFTALFSRQWELQRDPKDDSIFIDRDGKLFNYILAYLRTELLPVGVITKGPTITIVQSNNDYLFGGYTSVAWTSVNAYAADSNAFLFTLTNPHNIPPTKYQIEPTKTQYAVNHNSGYGPTFGLGRDLLVSSNSNSNKSSYTEFPNAYTDTTAQGNNTFTENKNFTTSDIEVFKLA